MSVTIAFLVYKESSYHYLSEFLTSLKEASDFLSPNDCQILVGDNSGKDDINRKYFKNHKYLGDKEIKYYDFGRNLGFAKAFNILIKKSKLNNSSYFLMLNPDILVDKESIKNLFLKAKNNPNIAALAPKILVWDFKNNKKTQKIDSCGIVLKPGLMFEDLGQGEIDEGQYDNSSILGPSGAAAFFKISALDKVKEDNAYFDENFFMYKEDCDLSYRFYLNKLETKLIVDAIFYHDRSVSGGALIEKLKKRKIRSRQERIWSFRGQHYIFKKHWLSQSFSSKIIIVYNIIKIFIFSLFFERFILKEYFNLFKK